MDGGGRYLINEKGERIPFPETDPAQADLESSEPETPEATEDSETEGNEK